MKTSGGQPGNNNAGRGCEWRDAIRHELATLGRKARDKRKEKNEVEDDDDDPAFELGLRVIARQCISQAAQNLSAVKEIGDRMDGKVPQALELGGMDGKPIDVNWMVEIVEPKNEGVPANEKEADDRTT